VIPPAGIGEVLDLGFNLARHNFKFLLIVYAWAGVPSLLLTGVAFAPFFGIMSSLSPNTSPDSINPGMLVLAGGGFFIGAMIAALCQAIGSMAIAIACARLIAPSADHTELQTGRLYREAAHRLGGVILWGLLLFVPTFFLIFVFPLGIYIGVRWSQSWIALVVDGEGPVSSLGRSWALTRGSWWHTAIVLLAMWIIVSIVGYAFSAAVGIVIMPLAFVVDSPAVSGVANLLGQSIGGLLLAPFQTAIAVVLYFELRARAEGFDLEQRALQVAPSE
jgi:hypothetical protein